MAWNIPGLEDPSTEEFLSNPDFRQIATFFLGWVFSYSAQIILFSPLTQRNFKRGYYSFLSLITKLFKKCHGSNDIEARASPPSATVHRDEAKTPQHNTGGFNHLTTFHRRTQGEALLVTLALCFTCASVAHFASLLGYSTGGETACAFIVAWGGTAAQVGRLIGLLILSLELKKLPVGRWEVYIFWVLLFILLGLVFTHNAITIGTLRPTPLLGISLCYRRYFTFTALASSLAFISAELYLIIRFVFLISPRGLGWSSKLDLFGDSRVYRTLSLLLLDGLTITSAAKSSSLLVYFVPFTIGVVVVLLAFDLASPKGEGEAPLSPWSHCGETRRFASHPTPAPSIISTISIRRTSDHTTHTPSPSGPSFSERDPPPAPIRSALSLRAALRNFTTQDSQPVTDGHTKAEGESPTPTTFSSPATGQLSGFPHSDHSETETTRPPVKRGPGHRLAVVTNPGEWASSVPQFPEGSVTPDLGTYTTDFLRVPLSRRSTTSSGLTYLSPISQGDTSGRRPSYLLSPSKSYQQSIVSTSHAPIPTWEEIYRQQGLHLDLRFEVPFVPGQGDSLSHQPTSSHTPTVPSIPFIPKWSASPPPGPTKFKPIQPPLLANTPPAERTSGIKGPRPLVMTSRLRVRPSMDDT